MAGVKLLKPVTQDTPRINFKDPSTLLYWKDVPTVGLGLGSPGFKSCSPTTSCVTLDNLVTSLSLSSSSIKWE